jgi:hypothetical protein
MFARFVTGRRTKWLVVAAWLAAGAAVGDPDVTGSTELAAYATVITSAGIVLARTFAKLAVLPLVALVESGRR